MLPFKQMIRIFENIDRHGDVFDSEQTKAYNVKTFRSLNNFLLSLSYITIKPDQLSVVLMENKLSFPYESNCKFRIYFYTKVREYFLYYI